MDNVMSILESGTIQINDIDYKGRSALHYSVMAGQVELSKFFIDSGLDVNSTNYDGETPLHIAVKTGEVELIQLLLLD